jgi:hypothetical protein
VRSKTIVIPTREEQEKLLRDAGLKGAINRELIGEGIRVLKGYSDVLCT